MSATRRPWESQNFNFHLFMACLAVSRFFFFRRDSLRNEILSFGSLQESWWVERCARKGAVSRHHMPDKKIPPFCVRNVLHRESRRQLFYCASAHPSRCFWFRFRALPSIETSSNHILQAALFLSEVNIEFHIRTWDSCGKCSARKQRDKARSFPFMWLHVGRVSSVA